MGHIFGLKFKYLLICADHPNVNLQLIGKSNNIPGLGILCRITGNNDTEMLSERVAAAESKCWHMIIVLFVADSFMFSSKMFQVLSYHFCFMYQQIQLFFCRFYQSRCWLVKKAYLMVYFHWSTLSNTVTSDLGEVTNTTEKLRWVNTGPGCSVTRSAHAASHSVLRVRFIINNQQQSVSWCGGRDSAVDNWENLLLANCDY